MNAKDLFNSLSESAPERAQIVGRNILSQNPNDLAFAEIYLTFCIKNIVSLSNDISDFFINESERTLQHISNTCDMSEEYLQQIDSYSSQINEQENIARENFNSQIFQSNQELIKSIENEFDRLRWVKDDKSILFKIEQLDAQLIKEMLSNEQKDSYNSLVSKISDYVATNSKRKARENNLDALSLFNSALETFNSDKIFKKDKEKLEGLIKKYLCKYDVNTLDSEVALYYNYVYNYIFTKVKDELKFNMVECVVKEKKR